MDIPTPAKAPSADEKNTVLRILALAVAYAVSGYMGLAIPYISNITLIWLPTGIAVAALARWGTTCWPGIALGALAVELTVVPPLPAVTVTVTNTLAPVVTVWLLNRWGFHRDFDRHRDILIFVAAALAGMLISSTGGISTLATAGTVPAAAVFAGWLTWWLGDAVGVLLAGPLLLSLNAKNLREFSERRLELLLWLLVTALACWGVFFANPGSEDAGLPLAFIPIPLLVWAALRLGITGASLAVLLLSVGAALSTAMGSGPFHGKSPQIGLLLLWAYTLSLAVVAMMITALDAERRRALEQFKTKALHLRTIVQSEPQCVKIIDHNLKLLEMNQAGLEMIEADSIDQVIGKDIGDVVLPAYRDAFNQLTQRTLEGASGTLVFEIQGLKGRRRWLDTHTVPLRDPDGNISGALAVTRDVTQQKEDEEAIHRLAFYDPLTGLPNRRLLLDRIGHALAHVRRTRDFGALMILDLDHFKTLNDTQGHDVGDTLLQAVAERLNGCIRECDTVARLGGDEFVVLIEQLSRDPRMASEQAETIGEKIRHALSSSYVLSTHDFQTSVSLGICLFHGEEDRPEDVLKRADLAMYQAKGSGRNALCFFDPSMQERVEQRVELDAQLRHALDAGELTLHYQAQLDREFRVIGAEALLRWRKADQVLVPPDTFIPFAEESGLILPIGRWVLESACRQIVAWGDDPLLSQVQISVNVSVRQFRHPAFVEDVQHILAETGCKPDRLKFELTESVAIDDVERVVERMGALKELGIRLSLDDFGTGYSSLSYLRRLPLDQLKIDRSFIRDITTDADDAAIVRAIIAMADTLGIEALAEGVETITQLEFLDFHGCRAFQGYYFSRPLTATDFERFVASPESLRKPNVAAPSPKGAGPAPRSR